MGWNQRSNLLTQFAQPGASVNPQGPPWVVFPDCSNATETLGFGHGWQSKGPHFPEDTKLMLDREEKTHFFCALEGCRHELVFLARLLLVAHSSKSRSYEWSVLLRLPLAKILAFRSSSSWQKLSHEPSRRPLSAAPMLSECWASSPALLEHSLYLLTS